MTNLIHRLFQRINNLLRPANSSDDSAPVETPVEVKLEGKKRRTPIRGITEDQLLEAAYTVKLITGTYPKRGRGSIHWRAEWQRAIDVANMPSSGCYSRRFGTLKEAWIKADEWGHTHDKQESDG